jgi:hypothetical protein
VAESSTERCFFFENNGKGSELGGGDTEKADPAYISQFPATGDLRSTILICFETVLGSGPNLSVLVTTKSPPFPCSFFEETVADAVSLLLIFESSDSPRRKIVTFSITLLLLLLFL